MYSSEVLTPLESNAPKLSLSWVSCSSETDLMKEKEMDLNK